MQTTFAALFGILRTDERIDIKSFEDAGGGMMSATFQHKALSCTVQLSKSEVAKLLLKDDKTPPKTRMVPVRPSAPKQAKEQLISDEEMDGFVQKRVRRVPSPLTGEMITWEQYHQEKAQGKYVGTPTNGKGIHVYMKNSTTESNPKMTQ